MDIINILLELHFRFYVAMIGMLCGIYLVAIVPLLFHLWIIPRIEDRYGVWLKIKDEDYYYVLFAGWLVPPLSVSIYIVCKYLQRDLPGIKRPIKHSLLFKLKEIKYDISLATKAEIILSFMTMGSVLTLVLVGIVLTVAK